MIIYNKEKLIRTIHIQEASILYQEKKFTDLFSEAAKNGILKIIFQTSLISLRLFKSYTIVIIKEKRSLSS